MSETMMLALDGRYESFTLGKTVNSEQVRTMSLLAAKHGFGLAGYRSFEKAVTEEQISQTLANVHRLRKPFESAAPLVSASSAPEKSLL